MEYRINMIIETIIQKMPVFLFPTKKAHEQPIKLKYVVGEYIPP